MSELVLSSGQSPWWRQIGPLRWFVAFLVLMSVPAAFMQNIHLASPWNIIIGSIMPGLALFMIWAIPLDILMAKVFKSEADAATEARYRTIIRFDVLIWLLMLVSWGYFFLGLIGQI